MANTETVKIFFEDMTFGSTYKILEEGKDAAELKKVGEKIGMTLPSPDIAIFKGMYALVDEENRNKCTLPKKEVEKALSTIRFKAVDIDHIRDNTVGFWIDASLEGDQIVSYGAFWKANHEDEYKNFKDKMDKGGVAISFEAWGERKMKTDGSYDLMDIHFAGGALLDKEDPACPTAGVLEFASQPKNRILEFAKVMDTGKTDPNAEVRNRGDVVFPADSKKVNDNKDHFPINSKAQARNALARVAQYSSVPKWYDGTLTELVDKVKSAVKNKYSDIEVSSVYEQARISVYDMTYVFDIVYNLENPNTKEIGFWRIDLIDFENNLVNMTDMADETKVQVNLTPKVKEIAQTVLSVVAKSDKRNTNPNGGNKLMDEQLKKLTDEIAAVKVELAEVKKASTEKDATITSLKTELEKAQKTLETKVAELSTTSASLATANAKVKEIEDAKAKEVEAANTKLVAERRTELAEFAKDMKDEDLLNNDKYEIAKLKKTNADLIEKAGKAGVKIEMAAGSKTTDNVPEAVKVSQRIHKDLWGTEEVKK